MSKNSKEKMAALKKKQDKGWIIAIIVTLIIVAIAMGITIYKRAESQKPYPYDLSKYVKVGEYKDLPYYTPTVEVTDEDVQSELDSFLNSKAITETVLEGIVEEGDKINIAFVGKIDGEEFEGGTSESFDLTVGVTSMIDGFVEGLIGKKVGETVQLDLQFPDDYSNAEVAGKPVVFDVTINNKSVTTVPELTDELVAENTDFETIDAYKEDIRSKLLETREQNAESEIKSKLWHIITHESEALDYPEAELAEAVARVDASEAQYKSQAASYGLSWEDYLSMFLQTDEEGFAQMKDEAAHDNVLADMVMYQIARTEKVKYSNREFKADLADILERNDLTEEDFQNYYGMTVEEYAEENNWKNSLFLEKVLDKVKALGREVTEEEFNEFYDAFEEAHAEPVEETEGEAEEEAVEGEAEEAAEETAEEAAEGEAEEATEEATEGEAEEATEETSGSN